MSYSNFQNINPLIAVFNSTSQNSTLPTPTLSLNTSLYQGTVSSSILNIDYNSTLRGDFYGDTTASALFVFAHLTVDGVDGYQATELSAGYESIPYATTEVYYANPLKNKDIQAKYRRNTGSSITVTTDANFPRITGITTP